MNRNGSLAAVCGMFFLGACSFFSDFPDVEGEASTSGASTGASPDTSTGETSSSSSSPTTSSSNGSSSSGGGQGGGSSSSGEQGGGGAGTGAGDSCRELCQVTFDGDDVDAPVGGTAFDLTVTASAPAGFGNVASSSVWITELVGYDDERYVVGHASSTAAPPVVVLPDGTTQIGTVENVGTRAWPTGLGFVLDGDATTVLAAAATCAGELNGGETFFLGATTLLDPVVDPDSPAIVVGGAFQGEDLRFYETALDCEGGAVAVDAPGTGLWPFVAWIGEDGFRRALSPTSLGVIADVAAIPDSTTGSVVAVGYGSGDTFGTNIGPVSIYVLSSSGSATHGAVRPFGLAPCASEDEWISGQKAGIAVFGDDVWVAGTHCTAGGEHQAFVAKVGRDGDDLDAIVGGDVMLIGAGEENARIAITKIVATNDYVFVAGTHSGEPTNGNGWSPGQGETTDDGFVMRFPRVDWDNTVDPDVFRPVRGAGAFENDRGTIDIRDMKATADGGVLIAGRYVANLELPDVNGCYVSGNPVSRAFFVELSSELDTRWARIEGFENGIGVETSRALGTAVDERADGSVLTATLSHGPLKLLCDGEGAPTAGIPLARARTLPAPGR